MQTNNSKEKVRQLQNKLYLTAKKCDSRRFHALYDKVYRDDVLFEAWKRVKANKGSSGVDGIGIEDIEEMGIEKYLSEIKSELMDGKYKPSPVKRVMIPKPDGSERPLGIPTVKDRIVQMAAKIAIEPVFEADFRDCSYGFRPKRSARQALEVVRKACNNKGYYVVDADIEKFFDNVNQDKLMKLAEQRISDRRILKLIRQWLVSGVLYGNVLTISELGTSQGSVISPLLANIYLNTLDRLWEKYGLTHGILVRYADDTVIICKNKKNANHALNLLQYIMAKLDLKIHPVKTKIVSMWDGKEGFDFLGMHHRRMTTETSKGQLYKETYQYPSRKAMKKMKTEIKKILEALPRILPNMDKEISQNLKLILKKRGIDIHTAAAVQGVETEGDQYVCKYIEKEKEQSAISQYVLCAVGRCPNTDGLFSEDATPEMNRGRVVVNEKFETSIPGVYAIGDLIFGAQLAHTASAQGIQVAEQLAGKEVSVDVNVVPGCVYTDPEIASVGITEDEAKEKGIAVKVGKFIMSANGKSLIIKEERGFIKIVAEEESGVIVGAQMMCARATDMISEFVTAVANNMTVSQLLKGMRAHPTYNEGIGEALEELEGGAIHVMPKKKIIFYNFEEEEHIWEVFLIF